MLSVSELTSAEYLVEEADCDAAEYDGCDDSTCLGVGSEEVCDVGLECIEEYGYGY